MTTIQKVYAECVQKFAKGNWTLPTPHPEYQACAFQSTIMLAVLARLEQGQGETELLAVIPASFHDTTRILVEDYAASPDKAAMTAALGSKECIARAHKSSD